MLTIVKIKKADDHVSVEFDNDATLKIPARVAGMYRLETGRSVDQIEFAQLREESDRFQCRKKALDYLAVRPRSAAEMERYLSKKGFSGDIIRETVTGIRDAGYIDDADYAARYISDRLNRKLVGKNLLYSELLRRGVPRNIIRHALKESEALHANADEVYTVAMKKYEGLRHKSNPLVKLSLFLRGRGFDGDLVDSVIERIRREDAGAEEEM
ncbi:MAG: regulatory protein RecX [Spirochaetes bacterium]|nr:regulatory protein RecX [Spirochaetota bacterium]